MTGADSSDLRVVTGAAGGIGYACARRLARHGRVLLSDVDPDRLARAADSLRSAGCDVEHQPVDVGDPDSVAALAERAAALGPVSTLVHAAGASPLHADWRTIVRVNLVGTAYVVRDFLPLAQDGASAVCIGSITARRPVLDAARAVLADPLAPGLLDDLAAFIGADSAHPHSRTNPYTLSKVGVVAWVPTQAAAWAARGARVNTVSPGVIDTDMGWAGDADRSVLPERVKASPLGRMGTPDEVAAVVEFVAGHDASFMTGSDVLVDGGITTLPTPVLPD